jgi:hypothetical protein
MKPIILGLPEKGFEGGNTGPAQKARHKHVEQAVGEACGPDGPDGKVLKIIEPITGNRMGKGPKNKTKKSRTPVGRASPQGNKIGGKAYKGHQGIPIGRKLIWNRQRNKQSRKYCCKHIHRSILSKETEF